MKIRWPFKKVSYTHWLGINLSELNPSAVIYCAGEILAAKSVSPEEGLEALELWLKEQALEGMPVVLILDDKDYELLLTEAPNVPDDELNAAMEFRIADLLTQDISETAIQAIRLPEDAYRGRMSMAHVIAASNKTIEKWVDWAGELKLNLALITVPELCLLNLLALFEVEQGIGLLELGPKQGCIRLYQQGALYLTRQVEVGLDALELAALNNVKEDEIDIDIEENEPPLLDGSIIELENSSLDIENEELDSEELDLELSEDDDDITDLAVDDYVSFSGTAKVNEQQLQNLILEVQRSLDYYESQLGMGQITRLWLMSEGRDLSELVTLMGSQLSAKIEQPDIATMLANISFQLGSDREEVNNSAIAIGGAAAYVGS